MVRFLKKVGMIIMSVAMLAFSGCKNINNQTAEMAKKSLYEKYGCEFEVTHIGDRLNQSRAKLYANLKSNPDIKFTIYVGNDGTITDDYIVETKQYEYECEVKKLMKEKGVECNISSTFYGEESTQEEDKDISITEYIEKYEVQEVFSYMIFEVESYSEEAVKDVLSNVGEIYGVKEVIGGYVFDNESYQMCNELFYEDPNVGATVIERKKPEISTGIVIENGMCTRYDTKQLK